MQVTYHCNRCEKDVVADVLIKGDHNKLVCTECKKYIKFIGKAELGNLKLQSRESRTEIIPDEYALLKGISDKLDTLIEILGNR